MTDSHLPQTMHVTKHSVLFIGLSCQLSLFLTFVHLDLTDILNFEEFQTYLRITCNKNKETTASILRDVQMYLNETDTTESDYKKLLDVQQLENFVDVMINRKEYRPTTRAEKLRRLNKVGHKIYDPTERQQGTVLQGKKDHRFHR